MKFFLKTIMFIVIAAAGFGIASIVTKIGGHTGYIIGFAVLVVVVPAALSTLVAIDSID